MTRRTGRLLAPWCAMALVGGTLAAAGLAGAAPASAATTAATCPVAGATGQVSCTYTVTVNPDGSVGIATTGSVPGDGDGDDVTVGVVNDSNGVVESVTLTSSSEDAFQFDGDGPFASQGYAGPGVTVPASGPGATGTVTFSPGLRPQGSAYFALERPPVSGTALLAPGLAVAAPSVVASEGAAFSGQVTTATDTGSISPGSEFAATIDWGDGTTSAGTVTGSAGSYVVDGTHTYAEEGTFAPTVVVDEPTLPVDTATSPAGTATVADAALVGSPVAVGPATTGVALTAPVATFTDAGSLETGSPSGEYSATISWGDGTTSAGTVTGSAGSYTVTGTHAYAAHGTTASPVSVVVTDDGGATTTVTDNEVAVADSVTVCSTGTCTSSLTTTDLTSLATTTSTTSGDLLFSSDPNSGPTAVSCGDPFRHAPRVVTESDTFTPGSSTITATDTFPESAGTEGRGPGRFLFWICFQSATPFRDLFGHTTTTGLLPLCLPFRSGSGPCVDSIFDRHGTIVERITYPVGDPRYG